MFMIMQNRLEGTHLRIDPTAVTFCQTANDYNNCILLRGSTLGVDMIAVWWGGTIVEFDIFAEAHERDDLNTARTVAAHAVMPEAVLRGLPDERKKMVQEAQERMRAAQAAVGATVPPGPANSPPAGINGAMVPATPDPTPPRPDPATILASLGDEELAEVVTRGTEIATARANKKAAASDAPAPAGDISTTSPDEDEPAPVPASRRRARKRR